MAFSDVYFYVFDFDTARDHMVGHQTLQVKSMPAALRHLADIYIYIYIDEALLSVCLFSPFLLTVCLLLLFSFLLVSADSQRELLTRPIKQLSEQQQKC